LISAAALPMQEADMRIRRRTIPAALEGGLALLAAAPLAAANDARLERVLDSAVWRTAVAPLLEAYRAALAGSPLLQTLHRLATQPAAWIGAATFVAGALVLLALLRHRRRGRGHLGLALVFPEAVRGEFEVMLFRRSRRRVGPPIQRGQAAFVRTGVRRETQFERVPEGEWWLVVEGTLEAPRSGAVLARVAETLEVEIDADEDTTIEHALPALATPVEIRVQWDRQPASDVGLCLRERPDILRHASNGRSRIDLAPGEHTLLVGAGDRVVEQPIRIDDYEPGSLEIDLATSEGLVFKGCPPAVAPFLRGDLDEASRALERDGQAEVASLLLARLHRERGQDEHAAEQLERAGHAGEAADLRAAMSQFERAAALYEAAGDLRNAAAMYAAAERWSDSARAHAALEEWAEAARCYELAGDHDALIGALEAQGELFRAAAIASERDDRARAIRLLQQVGPKDPEYGRAAELLALAYEQEGHLDLAANQLERRLQALAPGESAASVEIHLAELLDEAGEWPRALSVLERLRDREPTYPQIASRIESVRKKLSSPVGVGSTAGLRAPAGATAFVTEERYEILEQIGRGGMGLVFKARDRRLGRTVALKRLPENLREHPGAVQLFLGEAQAAARLNHPNIVTLYDADQENGQFFITMELLEGLPLNTILAKRGRFAPAEVARIGAQVCAGLQYAHDHGIVHRDIKTSNLFVTRDQKLKIMDFGLAKILEAVRDKSATLIAGTPFYMAPEQAAGRVSDGRTDLYSLGVTLFELSTGRLPFSEGDVAEQHRSKPPPDPAEGLPGYPPALAALILRMLAKAPESRPASAMAVAQVLMEATGAS
jgi:tRNA A-37 threonylcarbamoyl transferase component Bud32